MNDTWQTTARFGMWPLCVLVHTHSTHAETLSTLFPTPSYLSTATQARKACHYSLQRAMYRCWYLCSKAGWAPWSWCYPAGLLHPKVVVVWSSNRLKDKQKLLLPGFLCLTVLSTKSVSARSRTESHSAATSTTEPQVSEPKDGAWFPKQKRTKAKLIKRATASLSTIGFL